MTSVTGNYSSSSSRERRSGSRLRSCVRKGIGIPKYEEGEDVNEEGVYFLAEITKVYEGGRVDVRYADPYNDVETDLDEDRIDKQGARQDESHTGPEASLVGVIGDIGSPAILSG